MVDLVATAGLEHRFGPQPRHGAPASRSGGIAGLLRTGAAQRYLLLLRFALLNSGGTALMVAAYLQGWVEEVLAADRTYLSVAIFGLFVAGLALCAGKVWWTSQELNKAKEYDPFRPRPSLASRYISQVRGHAGDSRVLAASSLRLKMSTGIGIVRFIANSLVLLGLIGTVVGFIIALSGVDPQTSSDVAAIGPMVSMLIAGMSVALYTTLIGSVLNVWLMVNYHILAAGTVNLLTAVVKLGETHGRA